MDYTDVLRRLTIVDAEYVAELLRGDDPRLTPPVRDPAMTLARVAALAGCRAPAHAYAAVVDEALGQGLSRDEIVGVLAGIAPIIGSAALAAAAPALALALGYDTELALEQVRPS